MLCCLKISSTKILSWLLLNSTSLIFSGLGQNVSQTLCHNIVSISSSLVLSRVNYTTLKSHEQVFTIYVSIGAPVFQAVTRGTCLSSGDIILEP